VRVRSGSSRVDQSIINHWRTYSTPPHGRRYFMYVWMRYDIQPEETLERRVPPMMVPEVRHLPLSKEYWRQFGSEEQ
jgi:hypothetical protein